jgi:hypothetical protein
VSRKDNLGRSNPKERVSLIFQILKMCIVWNRLVVASSLGVMAMTSLAESFMVKEEMDPLSIRDLIASPVPCEGFVDQWELMDTKTNKMVQTVENGDVVYSDRPSFSIRAVVSGALVTRLVRFTLNVPYALCTNGAIFVSSLRGYGARCCGDGVIAVNHVGDCCPVAYIAVPIATLPDFTACCPTGTATVDSLSRCCGPNDILVISSTIANFNYCLPARYHCQFQLLWYHCQRRCAAPPILAAVP